MLLYNSYNLPKLWKYINDCKVNLIMNNDYKNFIICYMQQKNSDWLEKDNEYTNLLKALDITSLDNLNTIFESEDHILKFFWYKLLTRRHMPAHGFDCDKIFFEKSFLVTQWQKDQLNKGWTQDTANSRS